MGMMTDQESRLEEEARQRRQTEHETALRRAYRDTTSELPPDLAAALDRLKGIRLS